MRKVVDDFVKFLEHKDQEAPAWEKAVGDALGSWAEGRTEEWRGAKGFARAFNIEILGSPALGKALGTLSAAVLREHKSDGAKFAEEFVAVRSKDGRLGEASLPGTQLTERLRDMETNYWADWSALYIAQFQVL